MRWLLLYTALILLSKNEFIHLHWHVTFTRQIIAKIKWVRSDKLSYISAHIRPEQRPYKLLLEKIARLLKNKAPSITQEASHPTTTLNYFYPPFGRTQQPLPVKNTTSQISMSCTKKQKTNCIRSYQNQILQHLYLARKECPIYAQNRNVTH